MTKKRKYSASIRLICGVLSTFGIAALIFNYNNTGGIEISVFSLVSAFALFIFLHVAIRGTNPIEPNKNKNK